MDRNGIEQARERLGRLRRAAEVFCSNAPSKEREGAWFDFLHAQGTIFSKIEQAAKVSNTSDRWFAAKKAERKSDELLRYLHHARNAQEHSIRVISSSGITVLRGNIRLRGGGDTASLTFATDHEGKGFASSENVSNFEFLEDEIVLEDVVDRGVTYQVPKQHLGSAISHLENRQIIELARKYFEILIKEASTLD